MKSNGKAVYRKYKERALRKQIPFKISEKTFEKLTSKDCYLCGSKPTGYYLHNKNKWKTDPFIYNGLDRINPKKGYVLSNVRPCCFKCNRMKTDTPLLEFLSHISKVLFIFLSSNGDQPNRKR
jgi:hypothetical protein